MNLQELSNNVTALIKAGKLPKKFEVTEARMHKGMMEIAYGKLGKRIIMWDKFGKAYVSHGTQLGVIEDEDGDVDAAEIVVFQRVPHMDF